MKPSTIDLFFLTKTKTDSCPSSIVALQLESFWSVSKLNNLHLETLSPQYVSQRILMVISNNQQSTFSQFDLFDQHPQLKNYPVKICTFTDRPQSIPSSFIANFDDFIFLPCSADHFQSRLFLLSEHLNTHSKNESSLLIEFAHLNLKGSSDIFKQTLSLIKHIAKCDASVLINGETGTGKENAARAIHYLSSRQDKAFIPINCGAIPDSLLESELFGYERGAFTDAKQKQLGMIAIANNGTLFLDEVDSLSPKAQAALLRFLQTGEYRPLGSGKIQQSNVRIIAATNAKLTILVQQGKFREDLYFRLNVLEVRMPPLRERTEDIKIIAQHFLQKYLHQYPDGPNSIHPSALKWLEQQEWKGNVRELENILLREFLLSPGKLLTINNKVSTEITETNPNTQCLSFQQAKAETICQFEQKYLKEVLALTEGNVSQAARLAGKERRSLGKLIKKYNIDTAEFRPGAVLN